MQGFKTITLDRPIEDEDLDVLGTRPDIPGYDMLVEALTAMVKDHQHKALNLMFDAMQEYAIHKDVNPPWEN